MYSDYDHFSTTVDYGAYPTYEVSFHSANDSWVQAQWADAGGVELDPGAEAWSMPAPISPEAVCIRAGVDMMLAALENAQETFTLGLVELHGDRYEPRLDPASPHYFLARSEDFDPAYDSRLDPESNDYYLRDC